METKKDINTIIELLVNNHSGVMSHITGLFSRRAFNLDSIICSPINDTQSKMYLLVENDERLPQIISQLEKLYDVEKVEERYDYNRSFFTDIHDLIMDK